MKKENIFDILENAENEPMERLTEKCPDIPDEMLGRILAESERKYNMKKSERTMKDNIKITESDFVEGVEHSKRPVWLAPLSMAASLILIIGIAAGSTFIIKNHGQMPDDSDILPAASVTASAVTETAAAQSSDEKTTDTVTTAVTSESTAETSAASETAETTEAAGSTVEIASLVGKWTYHQWSDGVDKGTVEINADGTFVYTGGSLTIDSGIVKTGVEEIEDTKLDTVLLYDNAGELKLAGYYNAADPDRINVGNGGEVSLIRGEISDDTADNPLAGEWIYEVSDDGIHTVDQSKQYNGRIIIRVDGEFYYTAPDGTETDGTVETGTEEIGGTVLDTVSFYSEGEYMFGGYLRADDPNIIYIGNGGMARLVRIKGF